MRSTLKIRVAHAANFSFMSVSPDVCLVERDSYSFAALRESMLCRPKSAGSRCREQRRPGVLWNGPGRLRLPVCRWRPKVCGWRFWRLFACEAYVRVCGAGTRLTDIFGVRRHVSKVPIPDSCIPQQTVGEREQLCRHFEAERVLPGAQYFNAGPEFEQRDFDLGRFQPFLK